MKKLFTSLFLLASFFSQVAFADEFSDLFASANQKFEAGDYVGSVKDCDKLILIDKQPKKDSLCGLAYGLRGIAKTSLGDYIGAIKDLTESTNLGLDNSLAYSARADAKIRLKDYAGAIKDCNKAIQLNSVNAQAYLNRGVALSFASPFENLSSLIQDLEKAKELFEKSGNMKGYTRALDFIKIARKYSN